MLNDRINNQINKIITDLRNLQEATAKGVMAKHLEKEHNKDVETEGKIRTINYFDKNLSEDRLKLMKLIDSLDIESEQKLDEEVL